MVVSSLPDYSGISADNYNIINSQGSGVRVAILGFSEFPAALKYNRLYAAFLNSFVKTDFTRYSRPQLWEAPEDFADFTPSETTWKSLQGLSGWTLAGFSPFIAAPAELGTYVQRTIPTNWYSNYDIKEHVPGLIRRPVGIGSVEDSLQFSLSIAQPPELVVEYDDELLVPTQILANGKTSGYINRHVSQVFEWRYEENDPDGYHLFGPIEQGSAVFSWRAAPTAEWTTISINSNAQNVTIPAETFPDGTVYWKVSGTDTAGQTSETPIYALTTTDSLMQTAAIAPVSQVISNAVPITFRWTAYNTHGTQPTSSELQFSTDGATWEALATTEGNVQSVIIPSETFEPGTVYWRVRAFNSDNLAGNWSDTASFVFMAAPDAPTVAATEAPFSTISWQGNGQQAYELQIDGQPVGTFFGRSVSSYQLQEPLIDGVHTASVRIQNSFGLWSPWGETVFTVQNVPGAAVTLSGSFDVDGVLSWTTESTETPFLIYRDGVLIGRTNGFSFTDRFVLGSHSYYVLNLLPGGHFTRSNTVQGAMKSCINRIALASGGSWMELRLSENSDSVQSFSWTQTSSLRHIAGAGFPVLELSNFKTLVASYDTAFTTVQAAAAFEALRGQVVILKSRGGNVVIGALTQLQKLNGDFYIVYTFELQQIHWEDFVDDTDA